MAIIAVEIVDAQGTQKTLPLDGGLQVAKKAIESSGAVIWAYHRRGENDGGELIVRDTITPQDGARRSAS